MRKLIRSRCHVDHLGHKTSKFNWTEVFTIFGIVIRSFQLKNLGYEEILEIYPEYFPPGRYKEMHDTGEWYKAVTYLYKKRIPTTLELDQ